MRFLTRLRSFLAALLGRRRLEREMEREWQFHLDARVDSLTAGGLSRADAERQARREFGDPLRWREQGREARGLRWVQDVGADVRYALRQMRRAPGFSLVAILTVGLGIGVSTALFSVIDATMLRPLPYPSPEQLVSVTPIVTQPDGRRVAPTASMADMRLWQSAGDVFVSVAGWGNSFGGRILDGPEPERVRVLQFTEDYLQMHGVAPLIGRDFTSEDMGVGSPPVVLLGYGYWQSRYGGRMDIVGVTVRLDDGVATIVGVLPSWFNPNVPLSRPLRIPTEEIRSRGTGRVSVYGRLRPGVTIEQAGERLSILMADQPTSEGVARAAVTSRLESDIAGSRTTLNVLSGAVLLILLIACVNVAGLLLARGTARQSELAIRASLGAGRFRLIRQLLSESVTLALAGGVVGVFLAWISLDIIVANIPITLPANAPVTLNSAVLAATAGLTIPTALLCGVWPAMRLSRAQIGPGLARSVRQTGSGLSRRGGQLLIVAEVALGVVLVAGAGLVIRSFARLSAVDLGFNPDGLVTMTVLPLDQNPSTHKTYYHALIDRSRTIPGITNAGLVDNFVLGGRTSSTNVSVEGKRTVVIVFEVLPGYFETIGVTLRAGQLPTDANDASSLRAVVISESAARAMFPNGAAVGRNFTRGNQPDPWTVAAVIADLGHGGPLNRRRHDPQVFFPFDPTPNDVAEAKVIVLRSVESVPDLAVRLRQAAASIGPRALVEQIRTADDWFADRVLAPRRRTFLLGLLGALGLVLLVVGVFGITAYAVGRRTAEVGVRMAFGARPSDVVLLMVRDAALPVICGLGLGLLGAYYATRVIASFLFETTPHDPVTFVAVAALVGLTAILAAWIPARRAAKVDPLVALRSE